MLSILSSSFSSSITPPNSTPMPLLAQYVIVEPDRRLGAYPTFLRRSHFSFDRSGSILRVSVSRYEDSPQKPRIIERHSLWPCAFDILLAVAAIQNRALGTRNKGKTAARPACQRGPSDNLTQAPGPCRCARSGATCMCPGRRSRGRRDSWQDISFDDCDEHTFYTNVYESAKQDDVLLPEHHPAMSAPPCAAAHRCPLLPLGPRLNSILSQEWFLQLNNHMSR